MEHFVKAMKIMPRLLVTYLTCGLLVCNASAQTTESTVAVDAAAVATGKHYYQQVCAKCHEVGVGPVITGRGFPAATYVLFARHGNRAMPAFRLSDVDDSTLQAVADYLASTPVVPATTAGVSP